MKNSLLLLSLFLIYGCNSENSLRQFTPGEIWPDDQGVHINAHGGGILFSKGLYYWYGEHKIEGEEGNKAQVGVHVYSSRDLYNWKDEGIALSVSQEVGNDIEKGCILERPKVIYNPSTNKFVMWFHLELKGMGYKAARTGVAVSDSPIGPFTYLRSMRPDAGSWPLNAEPFHRRPVSDSVLSEYCGGYGCLPAHPDSLNLLGRDFEGGQMSRDMNLFVDENGKAYHIHSSEENSTLHISELNDDFTGFSGKYARFFVNRYMEAPALFRTTDGKYYLIASDCTGWAPNAARSAVADNIFGPWTELGNPCRGKDSSLTFNSQSTFVLPVEGKKDAFIFMADRWSPGNPIDGRYVWLPIQLSNSGFEIRWKDEWDLGEL